MLQVKTGSCLLKVFVCDNLPGESDETGVVFYVKRCTDMFFKAN